ncbi:hypothetical protein WICPIJ_001963 [Wickerhamomyces pijperi]|uniref:Ribosomal protein/NADH dehydrogenase domain-containing protein n=1 Tax=Wickerhamomyces pijperi TaxID=599730 RepID=A0A9P8TQ89_WICPI|nr:hypothetical protein WICPIJ_001963 [Wickerhamomyces pijperi]
MSSALPKSKLARHITRLNLLSTGPGSVKVSPTVESIELIFKQRSPKGHLGARKFWRENLPRIQYHNPHLSITVRRIEPETKKQESEIPALLKINYNNGQESKITKIKYLFNEDILQKFVKLTDAKAVETTAVN